MLFEANDALTADAVNGNKEENNLYDSVDGQLSLVNVLPDGSSEPGATFGAPAIGLLGGYAGNLPGYSHVISTSGSRVFWSSLETTYYEGSGHEVYEEFPKDLYVRENPDRPQSPLDGQGHCSVVLDACTVLISEGGRFWTATADGSKAFFTKGDLYEYDVESGQTTDLTPGVEVQGVLGASEDGEYIYYVDSGDNLYLWHDGASTLITTLSQEDGESVGPYRLAARGPRGDWQPGLGDRTAEVTPDGRGLVFMSNQSLKAAGYPDGYPNDGYEEVYVYEAEGSQLFCASCNPSGEPPQSNEDTEAAYSGHSAAAFLPISYSDTYMPRWMSDDGNRAFFDSDEPLVPQDTNGKQDVYEWERDGAGSCEEADGCIYLLSGGTSESASWLLDASTSGDDVFMVSRAELVPGDPYSSFDLYDARVGGVQPPTAPACSGTGCQGVPPAPPIFATPASVTFAGVGNFPAASTAAGAGQGTAKPKRLTRAQKRASALKACRRKRTGKRKRAACEARAKKRYGSGKASRRDEKSASKGRI